MNEIHITDVRTFLSCRRQWKYSSKQQMGLEPNQPNLNLWLGRIVHEALAFWYDHKHEADRTLPKKTLDFFDWLVDDEFAAFTEQKEEGTEHFLTKAQESVDLGHAMLRHYMLYSARNDRFDVLATELKVASLLPFPPQTSIVSTLDIVATDGVGELFIMDHKTSSRIPTLQDMMLDTQALTYMFAMQGHPMTEQFGNPKFFQFNFLLKREPRFPPRLKSGRLSEGRLGDTTLEIYNYAIKSMGHSWDSYTKARMELTSKPNKFFVRHTLRPTTKAIEHHIKNLGTIALEMADPMTPLYPSPDRFKCNWCAFKDACMMESNGVDPKIVLQAQFKPRS